MFRSSQALLLRPATINNFKIHPPLPMNPRESKQLLNLLTASFRRQLDAEHGDFRPTGNVRSSNESRNLKTSKVRRRSFSDSSRPTDQHMHSVLTNPLFNIVPDAKAPDADRDPMEVFDLAVAKGMMNIQYAKACLNAKRRDIIQSPVLKVRDGMKESGAGHKVVRWLVSSGKANDNDFLKDSAFANVLMKYMVAEGLQELAWKWITRAFQGLPQYWAQTGEERRLTRRDIIRPLYLLIRAEASENVSLDAAYLCLSRAAGYLKGMTFLQMRDMLGVPGCFLINQTLELHSERPRPSPSAFDSFLSLVPILSKHSEYSIAHLNLRHPSEPNADLALQFLRNAHYTESSKSTRRTLENVDTIQLSLDTAKLLLEREQYGDAHWVMDFLRERYPDQLGIKQKGQLEQAKAEASSLQLLERLSLV